MATPRGALRYPPGGSTLWVEDSLAGQLIRAEFFGAEGDPAPPDDVEAPGAVLSASTSLVAGSASGVRSPTQAGAALTATSATTPGAASGVRSPTQAGTTLAASLALVAGSASGAWSPTQAGAALTTTVALAAGAAAGAQSAEATGATLSLTASLVGGAAQGEVSASADGAALAATAALSAGLASATRSEAANGSVFALAASAAWGAISVGSTLAGVALAAGLALAPGDAVGETNGTASGAALSASVAVSAGTTSAIRSPTVQGVALYFSSTSAGPGRCLIDVIIPTTGTSYDVAVSNKVEATVAPAPVNQVVLSPSTSSVSVSASPSSVSVACGPTGVTVNVAPTTVIIDGDGLQGPPGETEGATFNAIAGATIHGDRVVRMVNGQVFHPSLADNDHAEQVAGIALNSANPGQTVLVRSSGAMTASFWSWLPGAIWCGVDGQLTQTPTTGWLLQVARVTDATAITVDIETPIYRS